MNQKEVLEVIEEIKQKNEKVVADQYKKHKKKFIGFLKWYRKISHSEALDYYQDAFVIFYTNVMKGEAEIKSIENYLIGIGKNLVLGNHKQRKKLVEDFFEKDLHTPSFIDELDLELEQSSKEEIVRLTVGALGDPCAQILRFFYWERINYPEMLKKMTNYKSVEVLKAQKYKCMQRLKLKLKALFTISGLQ